MPVWTVYCHTLITDGRRYVGLTARTMERRWSQHVCHAKNSKGGRWHFPNAIRKYGKDAFSHDVLGTFDTLEAANDFEKAKILEWDLRNPEKGFNLAEGGEHVPHSIRKNPWDRPEYRAKCTEAAKFTFNDPAVRSKIRQAQSSSEYRERKTAINREILSRPEVRIRMATSFKGRSHTPETREKIAHAHKGKKLGPEHIAKMSESIRTSPRMKATQARRTAKACERSRSLTHQNCLIHGSVPVGECYRSMKGGMIRYQCRVCRARRTHIRCQSRALSPSVD